MTDNLPADPRDPSFESETKELEMVDPKDVPSDARGWSVAAHLLPLVGVYILGALFFLAALAWGALHTLWAAWLGRKKRRSG